jgi:hypothetical protein
VLAKENIHPYFVTGFIDGEGCFMLIITENNRIKRGWRVQPCFSIGVHLKDRLLLEKIMATLGVGQIYKQGKDSIQLRVESLKDIDKLIKFLDKYPLISQKRADYELFKQAFYLISNKEHLSREGLHKIVAINASMNLGLPVGLKAAFPSLKYIYIFSNLYSK